jgi:hypothetical protein
MDFRKNTIPFDDKFKRVGKKDSENSTFSLLLKVGFPY